MVIMADDISDFAQAGAGTSLLSGDTTAASVLAFWDAYDSAQGNTTPTIAPPTTAPVAIPGVGVGAGAGVFTPQVQPNTGGNIIPAVTAGVPAVASALGVTLPEGLLGVLGAAGAIYGGLQALGLGEGGGLFGNNLLGGDDFTLGGVQFGGPGLSEPLAPYKEWHMGNKQFYAVKTYTSTGKYSGTKVFMYNTSTKQWKYWRLPKPHLAVIGKNMPRHQMIVRLRKNLKRHTADARTILKLTSPQSLKKSRRRR